MKKKLTIIEWKLLQWLKGSASSMNSFSVGKHGDEKGKVFFWGGDDFVKDAHKAALRFIRQSWVEADEYGNYRLKAMGLAVANNTPKPAWNPPAPPPLADRDFEVLDSLHYQNRLSSHTREWATPLDCGGRNGSHHSASLSKLVRHGLAECRKGAGIWTKENIIHEPTLRPQAKGSRSFRITDAGVEALRARD